jgi:hypothetical protein
MDYQDAVTAGLGVTEFSGDGRAAREIATLWQWARALLADGKGARAGAMPARQVAA